MRIITRPLLRTIAVPPVLGADLTLVALVAKRYHVWLRGASAQVNLTGKLDLI
jgi:hypothetical protein